MDDPTLGALHPATERVMNTLSNSMPDLEKEHLKNKLEIAKTFLTQCKHKKGCLVGPNNDCTCGLDELLI
jgi:hypothetical protein